MSWPESELMRAPEEVLKDKVTVKDARPKKGRKWDSEAGNDR